jgi:hypothetical protein
MYGGHPRLFLELARHGGIELAVSDPLHDEVLDVWQRKFLLSPYEISCYWKGSRKC